MLPLKTLTFAILIYSSVPTLHGQTEFDQAHQLFSKFWTTAMSIQKTDIDGRAKIRKAAKDLPSEMQPLMYNGILSYLNSQGSHPSDKLKDRLSQVLTPPSFGGVVAEGIADTASNDNERIVVVAYAVNYCIVCSRTWLGIFVRTNGKFHLAASADDASLDQTVHVALFSSARVPTVLLYGVHLGDAHNRLDAQALRPAGNGKFHVIWSRVDEPQGRLHVDHSVIEITHTLSLNPSSEEKTDSYKVSTLSRGRP